MRQRDRIAVYSLLLFVSLFSLSALTGCSSSSSSPAPTPQPISVSITNKLTTITAGTAAVTLNASVQNDSSNSGVAWTLVAGTTACSPTCGTLGAATTTSVTYTPPPTLPAAPNNAPAIVATSAKDSSKSDSDSFTLTAPAISVTIDNKVTTVLAGTAAIVFHATTNNDSANQGVTWTLTVNGSACPIGCGAISNATPSTVTYTPPATNPGFPFNAPLLTATSVSDTTKSDRDAFTLTNTTVTITNKVNAVTAGSSTIIFQATVQNDPSNSGVAWSLGNGGGTCSPGCGTLTNATTTSATYTPPAGVPAAPNNQPDIIAVANNSVGIPLASDDDVFTIISGTVSSCAGAPTGHEARLNGQYALFAEGLGGTGLAIAGSFAPDGTGKIIDLGGGVGGEIDRNAGNGPIHGTVLPAKSFYKVGADPTASGDLGCLQVVTSDGSLSIFHFSLSAPNPSVSTKGRIIEYDDQTGNAAGSRVSGVLLKQDPAAFAGGDTSHLDAQYAFGVNGAGAGPAMSAAGSWQMNPATGALSRVTYDQDDGGLPQTNISDSTGTISSVSAKTGRALLTLVSNTHVFGIAGIAVYIVNADQLFLVGLDLPSNNGISGVPSERYAGRAIVSTANSSALTGNFILHGTGVATCNGFSRCAAADLALLTFTSTNSTSGTVAGTLQTYSVPLGVASSNLTGGTYTVTGSNGRVVLSPGGLLPLPVFYLAAPTSLSEPIQAFGVGDDAGIAFGLLEPGAAQNIATSSLAGKYFFGDEQPSDATVTNRVGVVSISNTGAVIGTEDDVTPTGLSTQALSETVSIDNANGPGTGNVGPNSFAVSNGAKLFFLDEHSGAPASITVLEHE